MIDQYYVSPDGYLLSKNFHKDDIVRIIDHTKLNITKDDIKNYKTFLNLNKNFFENFEKSEPFRDKHYIVDMCLPYNPMPDENDIFVYYDSCRALSGTAGYARIRNGYVWGTRVVYRS